MKNAFFINGSTVAIMALISFIAISCNDENVAIDMEANVDNNEDLIIDSKRMSFFNRINRELSRIQLSPNNLNVIRNREVPVFDRSHLTSAFEGLTKEHLSPETDDNDLFDRGSSKSYGMKIDYQNWRFQIDEQEENRVQSSKDWTNEEALVEQVEDFMTALEIEKDEWEEYEVRQLLSVMRQADGKSTEGNRPKIKVENHVVFAWRTLGGIPIASEKFVFNFKLDGTLQYLSGRWTPINYQASRLATPLDETEFTDRAISTLMEAGIPSESGRPINLATHYRIVSSENGPILELRGVANTVIDGSDGPDGEGVGESFEFGLF